MNRHFEDYVVQIYGIACLYNLTLNTLVSKIHPSILSNVAKAILDAKERFPIETQLQELVSIMLYNNITLLVCTLCFTKLFMILSHHLIFFLLSFHLH